MQVRFLQLPVLFAASLFGADPSLLNYVMPDARFVAGIDIDRSKDSLLGRKLMQELESKEADLAKFSALTGFDPRRDLREILIASPDSNTKNGPALMVIRGTFDVTKIKTFASVSGMAAAENLNGIDVFAPSAKDDNAFAFLDGTLAIAGNKDAVRAAVQRRNQTSAAMNAEAVAKVRSISQANDIWMVSTLPVSELSKALPPGNAGGGMMNGDALRGIEQAALGVRFGGTAMDITAETQSKDAKDATALVDVVRFVATMVQMNRDKPEMKGLATALDAMKLSADGRTARISISVPVAEMEKMFNSTQKRPGRI